MIQQYVEKFIENLPEELKNSENPIKLDLVLDEIATITTGLGFFTVHMGPAGKILSDGRNAHLIQKPTSFWLPKLCQYFNILELQQHKVFGDGFWCIVQVIK